ncbi:unnamed protein product [Rhodiola kirilowii]
MGGSLAGGLVIGLMLICMCVGLNGDDELRLPKFAVPKHYSMRLQPDLVNLKFSGSVEIQVEIVQNTDRLILNAVGLDVPNSSIYFHGKNKLLLIPVKMGMDAESERIVLEFGEGLPIGVGVLEMIFNGNISHDMQGIFTRTYTINGEERNMLATQFESIHARRCFPCWDEPAFKATFTVTLDVPPHLTALSNMPVIEEKNNSLFKTVYFQKSPLMSTYLVAIVIGQFDHVQGHTSDGIEVRVYCPIGRKSEGVFGLNVGVRALDFYKEYLSKPFALPKLDMIAIPDFPQGMENYGLVIFGESQLLFDNHSSKVEMQQQVAEYVTHELAHQWFGNLVTLEWWTDTWLNEGFATWLSYTAMDSLFPEWNMWFTFITRSESALLEDASVETHPVVAKIDHLSEIDSVFDDIIYEKGSHIVRMLNAYLGPKTFQHSLAVYIKKYAWSNTRTDDLWTVLGEVSGLPVKYVMDSWTTMKGFPVVYVKAKLHMLELGQSSQSRRAYDGDQQWIVPVRLCCGSYMACRNIILQRKNELFDLRKLEGCSCTYETGRKETCPWIKLNVNRTGFYRVVYEDTLVSRLQHAVKSKQFSASDRYALLADSYQLGKAPKQKLTSLLSLLSAYSEEDNGDIVYQLTLRSEDIIKVTSDATPQLVGCLKQIFIEILENYAKNVGWGATQNESYKDRSVKKKVLYALAMLGHKRTLNEAKRRFHAYLIDRNTSLFPFEMRQVGYMAVMQTVTSSKRSDFNSLLNLLKGVNDNDWENKFVIQESLTCCPDPVIVLEALNFLFSPKVMKQIGLPEELDISWEGREVAWTWFKDYWGYLTQKFGSKAPLGYFEAIISTFASTEKEREVKSFFSHHQMSPVNQQFLRESIDKIHERAKWVMEIQKESNLPSLVNELLKGKCLNTVT